MASELTRDKIGEDYLASLPYQPYPVQEEAILAWFLTETGVLMCAPTGTGKTLVAQGALYEALVTGRKAYYTTPLIALTDQKFREMQDAAVSWGFSPDDIGLVTGNRRVNPNAKVLVVVAEILLNRLLNPELFSFEDCGAVVMDEFHSFNDPERGIVWELSLGLLPKHIRLMLLSATVGNAPEFLFWLTRSHGRKLDYVLGTERKVPLAYHWVSDALIGDHLVDMASGDPANRKTPALVFCFNREECWNLAEMLKGLDLLGPEQRDPLHDELEREDWSHGVGAKLKQLLWRGVGVHHAGVLPRYKRIVERLFLHKLLPVLLCTETLSAGLNLPARSVVLTELLKGPFGNKRLINASVAHQIFGRAGRPQFDDVGHVYALAHEDDVRISQWEEKLRSFPENPKDPAMIKAKKNFVRKKPTRRANQQYWTEQQFQKLIAAPPSKLASHGPIPWRLLAYLLKHSPDVDRLRDFVRKRLLEPSQIEGRQRQLSRMLIQLHEGKFLTLDPPPPLKEKEEKVVAPQAAPIKRGLLEVEGFSHVALQKPASEKAAKATPADYAPKWAHPTAKLDRLLAFRSIHPLYGEFLVEQLTSANDNEILQALESVLVLPRALLRSARPPSREEIPPGPMETEHLDTALAERGLIIVHHPEASSDDDDDEGGEEPIPPSLADKLRLLFDAMYPGVDDLETQSVWMAAEILRFGEFDKYVRTYKLVKQEGIVFRHVLRLILLCGEFAAIASTGGASGTQEVSAGAEPAGSPPVDLSERLRNIARRLTLIARAVDPVSTARTLRSAHEGDVVEADTAEAGKDKHQEVDASWEAMLTELLGAESSAAGEDESSSSTALN